MGCVSVILADRYPVFLCGLISVLREQDDFDIVASCCNGTECIRAIRNLSPRIALLDISMPGLSGLEILATRRRKDCAHECSCSPHRWKRMNWQPPQPGEPMALFPRMHRL